jgi:gliding motility-associated-like protein
LIAYTDDTNNPGPWSQISGPSGVIFSDPSQSVTDITVPQFGLYTFKYESCDTFSTTIIGFECPLEFPNSMTPNGDGNNDYFIINNLNPEIYSKSILTIYNRWGGIMYTSTEYGLNNNWWDGKTTYENKLVTDGIYYYILETYNNISNQKEEYSGELHLFISNSSSINKDHKLEINNRN